MRYLLVPKTCLPEGREDFARNVAPSRGTRCRIFFIGSFVIRFFFGSSSSSSSSSSALSVRKAKGISGRVSFSLPNRRRRCGVDAVDFPRRKQQLNSRHKAGPLSSTHTHTHPQRWPSRRHRIDLHSSCVVALLSPCFFFSFFVLFLHQTVRYSPSLVLLPSRRSPTRVLFFFFFLP